MADVQIYRGEDTEVPSVYVLPDSAEFILKAVNASFYDNGAAGDWLPCVTIVSDSGHVIARAVDQAVKVTAGDGPDVSWFPGVKHAAASSPSASGAPDYIMMSGVAIAIPSTPFGASGQVTWNPASVKSSDLATWTLLLDGSGNIFQVRSDVPGRYEAFASFLFDAPAASTDETFSISFFGGATPHMGTDAAITTTKSWEGFVGGFAELFSGTIIIETDYSLNTATTSGVRGTWLWVKRWPL